MIPARQNEKPVRGEPTRTFDKPGTWQAMYAAQDFLRILGFSVGSNQSGSPRGILFGDYLIAKWRNLSPAERTALHGRMIGDMRNGPITIRFSDNLPNEALAVLAEASALPPPTIEPHPDAADDATGGGATDPSISNDLTPTMDR